MTTVNFQIGQIVKINSNLTRHNKIAHSMKVGDLMEIGEIDTVKQRATVIRLDEVVGGEGNTFRPRFTIKLSALSA
jgi:hypothetical protein